MRVRVRVRVGNFLGSESELIQMFDTTVWITIVSTLKLNGNAYHL